MQTAPPNVYAMQVLINLHLNYARVLTFVDDVVHVSQSLCKDCSSLQAQNAPEHRTTTRNKANAHESTQTFA